MNGLFENCTDVENQMTVRLENFVESKKILLVGRESGGNQWKIQ